MTGDSTEDELLAEAVDWRLRIEAAPGDDALRAARDAWLANSDAHRSAWREVERLARVADALPADYADPRGAILGAGAHRPRPWRRRAAFAAVALAACLALLFLPTVQLWLASDHRTATAELRSVTLDDGSVVSLDAESAIAVRYAAGRREVVLLAGRAFFDVVPAADRPFVVVAGDARVTVLGTAFDVALSPGTLSVAVRSGTVAVALGGGGDRATLTRGDRLEIESKSGRFARSEIEPADVAAWRERRLIVDKATVAEVVAEFGRHYRGVIVLRDSALAGQRISGVFDLRQPIEALQAAVRTHNGTVTRITPYLVVISAR
ncbi:FecR family protein [Reyranella sp.]|uniref:FecR family protein n=1 Tax=Reyranella sp. TaxID=1929291 RepID=UPI003BAC7E8D